MQRMKVLFVILLLSFFALVLSLILFQFLAPNPKGNLIVQKFNEKIVYKNNEGWVADAIVIYVPLEFEVVQGQVKKCLNESRIGIRNDKNKSLEEEFHNRPIVNYSKPIAEIESLGFHLTDSVKETLIQTDGFNIVSEINGSSELLIKMIDGKYFFNGKEFCLIIIRRTDRWQSWLHEWHTGLVLPITGQVEVDNITNSELSLGKKIVDPLGQTLVYFLPKDKYDPVLEIELMKKIKSLILNKID